MDNGQRFLNQEFGPTSLPECNNTNYELHSRSSTPNSQSGGTLKSSASSVNNLTQVTTTDILAQKNSTDSSPQRLQVIERNNDEVYLATTSVVKAIITLSQGVEKMQVVGYLQLVKNVGMELRYLLASVDKLSHLFPPQANKEVEMAHKVLSKDMHELVAAMRLAQQYSETTLDNEYKKSMLSAAHVLAMDAKNLLDVVDSIRQRHRNLFAQHQLKQQKQTSNNGNYNLQETQQMIMTNFGDVNESLDIKMHTNSNNCAGIYDNSINLFNSHQTNKAESVSNIRENTNASKCNTDSLYITEGNPLHIIENSGVLSGNGGNEHLYSNTQSGNTATLPSHV